MTYDQLECVLIYLNLLMKWNAKINLTAIRDPEEALKRHFGEVLFVSRFMILRGFHLDIGSGAGFPGLVLKIAFPSLALTLLEPVAKKRAFLKEVVRSCGMKSVEIRSERLKEYAEVSPALKFDSASFRAVGRLGVLISTSLPLLKRGGKLCLWISREQVPDAQEGTVGLTWDPVIEIPGSRQRVILVGTRT